MVMGFECPSSDPRSASSPSLVLHSTPPGHRGLVEDFSQDEEELAMAFFSTFLEPVSRGSHEPILGVPFKDVAEVPALLDDDIRACMTTSWVLPGSVVDASLGGVNGGTHTTRFIPFTVSSGEMPTLPFDPWGLS